MRIFKTRLFSRWANSEGLADSALIVAVNEITDGLADAKLGGNVYKKRISLLGRGKRDGARTLLTYRVNDKTFFLYGFAKNSRANISDKELKALKLLATELLGYSSPTLKKAIQAGELIEVTNHDK